MLSVEFHDPHVPVILRNARARTIWQVSNPLPIEDNYDLILLSTDHAEYKNFDFTGFTCPIVDTRNCIRHKPQNYFQA